MSGFTSENESTPEIPLCLSHDILIPGLLLYNRIDNSSAKLSAAKVIRMSVEMMSAIMLERMLCLLIPI